MAETRTPADKHTMSQQWWQETAEELAAKVRGYFTNGNGKIDIPEKLDGDWDLYRTASRLTTRTVPPGSPGSPGSPMVARKNRKARL